MGQGPKVIEGLLLTPEEREDRDSDWALNPEDGKLSPKVKPSTDPQAAPKPQPAPVQAAHQYTD